MAKIQCYGCQEYGNYRKACPKLKKGNNKRDREEAHITGEVEEAEKKKCKKEEIRDLHYWDSLPHISSFQVPKSSIVRYGYHDSLNTMHQGIIEALEERARDMIIDKHERWLESMEVRI